MVSAILVAMLPGTPAQAIPRSWVSSTGGGIFCTRVSPCADFQHAHDVTDANGEINCVDAGDFTGAFGLFITKSITIDCGGTFGAASLSSSASPLVVNSPGVVVRFRNLSIQGGGTSSSGINFANGAALYVEHCSIFGYQSGVLGRGIHFAPPNGVAAKLHVTDSIIENNGQPALGGGIAIQPQGSGSALVVIERTRVDNNTYGIVAIGTGAGGLIVVHIRDSVVANSVFDGIGAYTSAGGSSISITVDHGSSLLNGGNGIVAVGPSAFAVLANSTVMSNVTGLHSAGGAAIASYQNNQLTGNLTDGAPTTMLSVK